MRDSLSLIVTVVMVGLTGCSTTPLTVEEHGSAAALAAGVTEESLEFVTSADVIAYSIDEAESVQSAQQREFSPSTKGLVVLTKESLIWAPGSLEDGSLGETSTLGVSSIQNARLGKDGSVFISDGDREIVVRPHLWSKFNGDFSRAVELVDRLADLGVETRSTRWSGLSPDRLRNDRSLEADYNSSPDASMHQDMRDSALYDWGEAFGNEGGATPPP